LPLPAIGLPPAPEPGTTTLPKPDATPPPAEGRNRRRGASAIYFVPTFPWGYPAPGITTAPSAPEPGVIVAAPARDAIPQTGTLRIEVQPPGAQLFLDGYFIGTPEDFNDELPLEAGRHSIELRMHGYETITVPTQIATGQTITYRGALKRVSPETTSPAATGRRPDAAPRQGPAEPQPPAKATTFYFIPGCYMGNVPPDQVQLPPTCDLSRLITRTP
jgi:cytoskeleton protein RodZ